MFPEKFEYMAPHTLDEASKYLKDHEDAKILAGGQSLIPLLKLRFTSIPEIIDIGNIKGIDAIEEKDGKIEIGCMARTADLIVNPLIRSKLGIIADAASQIADPLVRNRGTIGGDICHGDPANDFPACMLALNAEFQIFTPGGTKSIKAEDFFTDTFTVALEPGEILEKIVIPENNLTGRYLKYKKYAGDFSILGIAVAIKFNGKNAVMAGIGLTNCGATAIKAKDAENFIAGKELNDSNIDAAADLLVKSAEFFDDGNGTASFKEKFLKHLFVKAAKEIRGGNQ
ncbi:MAG: xanthine dehydrogenase family protein subunit M [Ferroplasma sp.]